MNVGVILAAGASVRFKSAVHKQYLKLNGKEVIYYAINEMRQANCFDEIIAVVDADEFKSKYIAQKYNITCIEGGIKRNQSIKNALDYLKNLPNVDKVVFHDCARPFIKSETFKKCVDLLDTYDAVTSSASITDALTLKDLSFVNRDDYVLIQTPEAFHFKKIYESFDEKTHCTAIVSQLKDRSSVYLLKDNKMNYKITYPEDLFLAEQLMTIHYKSTFNKNKEIDYNLDKVLLLGGTGGMGSAVKEHLEEHNIVYFAPTRKELDLYNLNVDDIAKTCPFEPDIIINLAAFYANDDAGLIETYDKIFNVNIRSVLVLIEYAKTLKKRVNIVVMGSSSSTKGRENLTNYSASKAALNSIVESQGATLSKQNIYLNAIIPEKINTPLIAKLHKTPINTRELLEADDIIDAIIEYSTTNQYGILAHMRKGL